MTNKTMPPYDFPLYRPPSEGENLIIQATVGCSFNNCTFCSMYRTKTFRIPPVEATLKAIDQAADEWPEARRVFLADGDALCLPMGDLLAILEHLAKRLPQLTRVSSYATPANLLQKTPDELNLLQANKLTLLYYGIETGSPKLLRQIKKGASVEGMQEGLLKAHAAKIKISATVILGLAGVHGWQEHIDGTLVLLNQTPMHYLSTLQLHLEPARQAAFMARFDPSFQPQTDQGILAEQAHLIAHLTPLHPLIFRSNHASNALALAGTLPKDRLKLLEMIHAAQQGTLSIRPLWLRGL